MPNLDDELGESTRCPDCGLVFWVVANVDQEMIDDGRLVVSFCPRCGWEIEDER